jgi:uncharacterized membrane protein YeaQ/YmgE (transglycosylase-associated protein family)
MWGGIIGLIIQLIAGGVGGNIAGSALKQYNLGTIGNTIAGVVVGVGAQIIGDWSAAERKRLEPALEASTSARSSVRSHLVGSAGVS